MGSSLDVGGKANQPVLLGLAMPTLTAPSQQLIPVKITVRVGNPNKHLNIVLAAEFL